MTTATIHIPSLDALTEAAAEIARHMDSHRVWAFVGEMGAGKTTLINAIARHFGVAADPTGSPTFAIVNEYRTADNRPIFHFDLYRLDSPEEVADTGFTDYLDSGHLCLIEWPDRAGTLLDPDSTAIAEIKVDPLTDARAVVLTIPDTL